MAKTPNIKLDKLKALEKVLKLSNDFYLGELRVRSERYLPKYYSEQDDEYTIRSMSTQFVNMYGPIIEGVVGLVTGKEPEFENLENFDFTNVDLQHNNLHRVIVDTATNSLLNGVSFVAVHTNKEINTPYLKTHSYEDLYSYEMVDNKLNQIVFKETVEVKKDGFGLEKQFRYIVYTIGGGSVWYQKKDSDTISEDTDLKWTNSLDEIPVVPIITGKKLSTFEIVPKLYDVAVMNAVHFNREGNVSNLINICSHPIPVIFGDVHDETLKVGVSSALRFDDKQREGFSYVEVDGSSIKLIQDKLIGIEKNIDKLTFNILSTVDSKTRIEAEEHKNKNMAFIKQFSNELESKFNKIIYFYTELSNISAKKDFKISLKKDFDAEIINIDIAQKALENGDMSRETFYTVLRTGQLPKDFDIEKENEKIEKDSVVPSKFEDD